MRTGAVHQRHEYHPLILPFIVLYLYLKQYVTRPTTTTTNDNDDDDTQRGPSWRGFLQRVTVGIAVGGCVFGAVLIVSLFAHGLVMMKNALLSELATAQFPKE